MNYAQTSACYLNILPPRIRQLVYDFDGRYKTAKNQCIELIRQRGQTPIGLMGSGKLAEVYLQINAFKMKTFHRDFPEYYAEVERRLSRHRALMEPSGHIRGVTTNLKRLPKSYCFKDALGSYKLGMVFKTVIIDGISYKSTEKIHSVGLETLAFKGTTTVVKCIDILDPVFKKTIKGRQTQKIKIYRSLDVSENGIPASIFKKVLAYRFGHSTWYWSMSNERSDPPASLAVVTDMLKRSKTGTNTFTIDGIDYAICIKTGTGIIYTGKKAVGYVTKKMKLRICVPVKPLPIYNPESDDAVEVDGKSYYIRYGLYIVSSESGIILGTVKGNEVVWMSDAR